jgi:hypothetical protein
VTTGRVARPRQVAQAIGLLWVSTALGLASSLLEAQRTKASWTDVALILAVMLGLVGLLTVKVWQGRHWARVLYLILVVTSLASFVSLWGTAERPPFEVALEAVSFVADAGSFFLMFTSPGASWFEGPVEPHRE